MLRRHRLFIILATSIAVALLTGCGQNSSSTGSTNEPSPTPTAPIGPVTLQVGATSYHPNDTIEVILHNAGNSTIYFPDHLTNCAVIQLQRQVNGNWEVIHRCLLMIATRWRTLDAGQSLVIKLVSTPNSQWIVGLYRATLSYRTSREADSLIPIYSVGFQVN